MAFNSTVCPLSTQLAFRLVRLALIRLVVALGLTVLDEFSFQLIHRPDIAPYLNDTERAILPLLFTGMLLTLAHIWIVTFNTFRAAMWQYKLQRAP